MRSTITIAIPWNFQAVAGQVVAEVDWAWSVRDVAVLRGSDEDSAIQEEYETRKRLALARLDVSIGEGPRAGPALINGRRGGLQRRFACSRPTPGGGGAARRTCARLPAPVGP